MTKNESVNTVQAMREVISMAKKVDDMLHQMQLLAESVGVHIIATRNIAPGIGGKYMLIRSGVPKIAEALGQDPVYLDEDNISVMIDDVRIESYTDWEDENAEAV